MFDFYIKDNITWIRNDSTMNLEVIALPIHPKRKHTTILILIPHQFIIIENKMDITRLAFKFTETHFAEDEK